MIRYKSIKEDFKSNFLDAAEDHLKNGNFHSAVRSVGRALGMRDIPFKYDKQITTQEKNFLANNNNINNFTVLQNIKKILLGKGAQVVKMQKVEPTYTQKSVDKKISNALSDYDLSKQEGEEIESEVDDEELEDTDMEADEEIENEEEIDEE